MKKLISALLVLAFVMTGFAQKKKRRNNDFTAEQKTELALKKMTLRLDLSKRQQRKIRPLLAEHIADRMQLKHEYKNRARKKLSNDERFERQMAYLDRKIAFKTSMKDILNEKQYERFEKKIARRVYKMKRRIQKRRKA